jgi:hypothetical protein
MFDKLNNKQQTVIKLSIEEFMGISPPSVRTEAEGNRQKAG